MAGPVEIRWQIARIFKIIWDNPPHREALRREAANGEQFVRFVNLMLNDVRARLRLLDGH